MNRLKVFVENLFGMRSAVILFVICAISCAVATFIESNEGSSKAAYLVYNSTWFEIIFIFLSINLIYNVYKYKLFTFKKLPSLMFHMAFICILIGAGITRYFGFEGTMHIRNQQTSNLVNTKQVYLEFGNGKNSISHKVNEYGNDNFELQIITDKKIAKLTFNKYAKNIGYKFTKVKNGEAILELILSNKEVAQPLIMKNAQSINVDGVEFVFNAKASMNEFIEFYNIADEFFMYSTKDISYFSQNKKGILKKNEVHKLLPLVLYGINEINFAANFMSASAKQNIVNLKSGGKEAFLLNLNYDGENRQIAVFADEQSVEEINSKTFTISASKFSKRLPFDVKLEKFELIRYPGSNSPMEYASYITIIDQDKKINYKIYPNNVLDYRGYNRIRFIC